MKKFFTRSMCMLFMVFLLAACTEISDPVEEINDLIEDQVVLGTEGEAGNDPGGPVKGE